MDLWDVIKLLARRWYASVPLLLASLASAVSIGLTTEPDYVATSHMTLLPPVLREDPATTGSANPWTVDSLMGAVVTRLNSKTQHDLLFAEGLSGVWEANPDLQFREQLALEVTADSEAEARATTRRLHDVVTEEVAAQQGRYRLREGAEITAVAFDQGENVTPAYKKIYRSMIAVVVAGMIVAFGLVIALDAILRWRTNRRSQPEKPAAAKTKKAEAAPAGAPLAPKRVLLRPAVARTTSEPASDNGSLEAMPSSTNGASAETTVLPVTRGADLTSTVAMEMKVTSVDSPPAPPPPDEPAPMPADATVVLPLTNALWGRRDKKRGDR